MKKRILSLIMVLCLVGGSVFTFATAAAAQTISPVLSVVNAGTAYEGDSGKLGVKIQNSKGVKSGSFVIRYTDNIIKVSSCLPGNSLPQEKFNTKYVLNYSNQPGSVYFEFSSKDGTEVADGTLVYLLFDVVGSAGGDIGIFIDKVSYNNTASGGNQGNVVKPSEPAEENISYYLESKSIQSDGQGVMTVGVVSDSTGIMGGSFSLKCSDTIKSIIDVKPCISSITDYSFDTNKKTAQVKFTADSEIKNGKTALFDIEYNIDDGSGELSEDGTKNMFNISFSFSEYKLTDKGGQTIKTAAPDKYMFDIAMDIGTLIDTESSFYMEADEFIKGETATVVLGVEGAEGEVFGGVAKIKYPEELLSREDTLVNKTVLDDYYDAFEDDSLPGEIVFEFANLKKGLPQGKTPLVTFTFKVSDEADTLKTLDFIFRTGKLLNGKAQKLDAYIPAKYSFKVIEAKTTTPTVAEGTVLFGDSDNSGKVNVKDATLIQKVLSKLVAEFDSKTYFAANVIAKDKLNIKDATMIQKHCAKMVESEIGTYVLYAPAE